MKTLVLGNVDGILQCAIGKGPTLLYSCQVLCPKKGTELLVSIIEHGFATIGSAPSEIERIACINGPGSFTGIRLVLTTALGIALPCNAPTASCSYLQALALSFTTPTEYAWCITKAKQTLLYVQGFSIDTPALNVHPRTPIYTMSPEEFALLTKQDATQSYIIGNGIAIAKTALLEHNPTAILLPPAYDIPAIATIYAFCNELSYGYTPIEPAYIRATDAEENRIAIAQKIGYTAKEAEAIFDKYMD